MDHSRCQAAMVNSPFFSCGLVPVWLILQTLAVKDMGQTAILFPSGGVQICQQGRGLRISTQNPLWLSSLRWEPPWNRLSYWLAEEMATSSGWQGKRGSRFCVNWGGTCCRVSWVLMSVAMCSSFRSSWSICRQGWQPKQQGSTCQSSQTEISTLSSPFDSLQRSINLGTPSTAS